MRGLKVVVTGATGLVGSHLVDYLVNKGYRVTALVHSRVKTQPFLENWQHANVEVVEADVCDKNACRSGLTGADIVVHAAGVVDPYGQRKAILAVNVGGTANMLALSRELGVKQFIYVSSLSVITGQSDQWAVTEEATLKTCGEPYADSKVKAEQLVMAGSGEGPLAVTAVRPGFIYGPRERSWLPRLIDSISKGKAALIDGGKKETNVIYVENLNKAIEATFLNPKANGSVYNLTDGGVTNKKQLFDAISDGLGLPRVTTEVPGAVARIFCETVSLVAPYLPSDAQRHLARYSRGAFRLVGVNQGFSIAKAERELDYVDRIPFSEGMAETLLSFKVNDKSDGKKCVVGRSFRD